MATDELKQAATDKPVPAGPLATLQSYFTKHRGQLEAALPKHLNPDRMMRLALTSLSQNKKLMDCDPRSVFGAVITASQLGLELGVLGQGFLVPYRDKRRGMVCQFIPGWQGLVDLVSRAGRANVWTGAVFEGDRFDYSLGTEPRIEHVPGGEDDPEKLTHVYAVGRVNGSQWPVIEVWPVAKVRKHRDRFNRMGTDHYSYQHPEMYARKIVLLQVLKYIPRSVELSNAIAVSEATETGATPIIEGDFVRVEDGEPEVAAVQNAGRQDDKRTEPSRDGGATSATSGPASPAAQAAQPAEEPEPEPAAAPATTPAPAPAPAKAQAAPEKKPAPAKGKKPAGTQEQQERFMKQLQAAPTTADLLSVAKEANAFNWPQALFTPLNALYHSRNEELTKQEEAEAARGDSDGDLLGDAQ